MIVDLLRNDLSRIAEPHSVRVPRLFHTEAWPTVWQMSSDVVATTRPARHAGRRVRRAVPVRLDHRRAQGAGDAPHPRAGARAARHLLRRDRRGAAGRRGDVQRADPHAGAARIDRTAADDARALRHRQRHHRRRHRRRRMGRVAPQARVRRPREPGVRAAGDAAAGGRRLRRRRRAPRAHGRRRAALRVRAAARVGARRA